MGMPVDFTLPVAKEPIYVVPQDNVFILSTIHVCNESGSSRTFTIYVKTLLGVSRPISPVSQTLAAGEVAIYASPMRLTVGCVIEGIASGDNVSCLITGEEKQA